MLYRDLLGIYYSLFSQSKIMLFGSVLMSSLDLYWTPWHSYKSLLIKNII